MDFWNVHGFWFLLFMCFFPRLTMLFTKICFMSFAGPLFWIGWVLAPRLTAAILATYFYFHTNPILCIIAWLWAFGGETKEKKVVYQKKKVLWRYQSKDFRKAVDTRWTEIDE